MQDGGVSGRSKSCASSRASGVVSCVATIAPCLPFPSFGIPTYAKLPAPVRQRLHAAGRELGPQRCMRVARTSECMAPEHAPRCRGKGVGFELRGVERNVVAHGCRWGASGQAAHPLMAKCRARHVPCIRRRATSGELNADHILSRVR